MESAVISRDDLGLSVAYRPPSTGSEETLAGLWQNILQLDRVGLDDDFFELGGDSLAATILASLIEKEFGITFAPAKIMSYSTVSAQAAHCAEESDRHAAARLPSYVVGVNLDGERPPLFLVHGANGFTLFKRDFFTTLGSEQPVYVFQAPGLDGRDTPPTTVEDFATIYAEVIRDVAPDGPWRIAASCAGALIALEICHSLTNTGEMIDKLIFIDPPVAAPSVASLYPVRRRRSPGARLRQRWRKALEKLEARRFKLNAEELAYERDLKKRARRQEKETRRIQRRELGSGPISAEVESSYLPEDMLRTAMAVVDAIRSYVPRPWPGDAKMIVSSARRGGEVTEDPFWRRHLRAVDYDVVDCSHADLFERRLPDVARIISDFLGESRTALRDAS
jgi:thioesterase domain-containing protein/acyl carrier protein